MRASVREDTATRVITVEVSDVPDVDVTENWHHRPRIMRPDHVTVRVVDGEVKELKASGPILRKDGEPGGQRGDTSWWPTRARYRERTVDNAPGWVRRLWAETPAGVTSWDDPGQPVWPEPDAARVDT